MRVSVLTLAVWGLGMTMDRAWAAPGSGETKPATQRAEIDQAEAERIATTFAEQLRGEKFEDAVVPFNKRMKSGLDVKKLKQTWESLGKSGGGFDSFGEIKTEKVDDSFRVVRPARWKKMALDMQVVVSRHGKISGLWFRPAAAAATAYEAPAYVKESTFHEKEVVIGEKPWALKGIVSIPNSKAKKPAVVLVHGSGPHDADEAIGPNRPFKDLAWGLATQGVVVLRYEKRTHAHGGEMTPDQINVKAEVIDDAVAAAELLRGMTDVDPRRVYVLGHSLGGCLAPAIAERDPKLAGVIILSGTLRSMNEVVVDQLAYIASLPGDGKEQRAKAFADTKAELAKPEGEQKTLLGVPVSYWRDLNGQLGEHGAATIREFGGAVLVLGGGRDYQITRKDFELWQKALKDRKNATLVWVPNVNHLFIAGEGMSTPKEYETAGHVDGKVVSGIASWIKTGAYGGG